MSSRYRFSTSGILQVTQALEMRPVALEARWNVAPGMAAPLILRQQEGCLRTQIYQWGLDPYGTQEELVNLRAEDWADHMGQAPFKKRCLVVADAFLEWSDENEASPQPWEFTVPGTPLVFAGLASEDPIGHFVILTTQANAVVAPVHERMPVILHRQHWRSWLNEGTGKQTLRAMLQPWEGSMVATPVSKAINKVSFQGPPETVPRRVPRTEVLPMNSL